MIRENVSGEDISSKVHAVLLLPTVSDKFGKWHIKLRGENITACTVHKKEGPYTVPSALVMSVVIHKEHLFNW